MAKKPKVIIYDINGAPFTGKPHISEIYRLASDDSLEVRLLPWDSTKTKFPPFVVDYEDLMLIDSSKLSKEESNRLLDLHEKYQREQEKIMTEFIQKMLNGTTDNENGD